MARIILTRALAQHTDDVLEHRVTHGDVRSALEQLIERYPLLRQILLNDHAQLREHINVFVNDDLIDGRAQLANPVDDGDTVIVLQSVSGGAALQIATRSLCGRDQC
jgi:molybdopterin converting factor small subunit